MTGKTEHEIHTGDKMEMIGGRILAMARGELYLKMRFLDVALCSYYFVMDDGIGTIGTDGLAVYYHPKYLGGIFREGRALVNRTYLHMVLHGIFKHMIRRKGRDERIYNLSCDIAVESITDGLLYRCVQMPRSWLRRETYRRLNEELPVLTADKIYERIRGFHLSEQELEKLEQEYKIDDHRYWPQEDGQKQSQVENQWQSISEQLETDMETFSKEASSQSGDFIRQVKVENKERFDYKEFLRKFAVWKEELAIDPESFDYGFYSYGLRLYGNMPLLEPQESREVKRVEEFVIVIDTSMSCSGELVKKFLEETYSVLSESESFFRKINIHIMQCDDQVKTDQKITNSDELREYMERFEQRGEGGTDFRPAFAYVDSLIGQHAFEQLKGLIYFTDGQGIYPSKMPPYETAFVFMKEDYEDVDVPPWAMKLILEEQDIIKNDTAN